MAAGSSRATRAFVCGLTLGCGTGPPAPPAPAAVPPAARVQRSPAAAVAARGAPEPPFACGEVDWYDLEAIQGGGALEATCSVNPAGTWRAVAQRLREDAWCQSAVDRLQADEEAQCAVAACANALFDGGSRSTCDDITPYIEARDTGPCVLLEYGSIFGISVVPCL
jgi:hypothetical protein